MNHSITFPADAVVTDDQGRPATTSLKVADVFGKNHYDVIKSIEALDCSKEFIDGNFAVSSYKPDGAKRSYPMYLMTRDGFTFLAMGYTGAKAAQFKEAYIAAFNQMEKALTKKAALALPDFSDPVAAARAWADAKEGSTKQSPPRRGQGEYSEASQ